MIYYTEQENLDGILFAANMEKVFDFLEHNFIHATLEKFGFGKISYSGYGPCNVTQAVVS